MHAMKIQALVMAESEAAGVCPFCPESLVNHHSPIEWGIALVVTKNGWPHVNTRVHLLAILKEHQESVDQLSDAAAAELQPMPVGD